MQLQIDHEKPIAVPTSSSSAPPTYPQMASFFQAPKSTNISAAKTLSTPPIAPSPWHPATAPQPERHTTTPNGFVFSTAEIDEYIRRKDVLDQARNTVNMVRLTAMR